MAGVTLRAEDTQVRVALDAYLDRLGHLDGVMDAIGGRLLNLSRLCFVGERDPWGSPWKPLAASTILQRTKTKHWPGPILRVKGATSGGLKGSTGGGLYGSLNYKPASTSVEIGAGWNESMAYAAIQLLGGPAGRGHKVTIPARAYLPTDGTLPDPWIAACLAIINQFLAEAGNA
jgi:phage gpG-like protein